MKSIKRGTIFLFILIAGLSLFVHNTFGQVYGWSAEGSGVNGRIYAIAKFNNRIVVAGGFTQAGGLPVNNIAQWDGSSWSALGAGLPDTVYALLVDTNNTLVAGGRFTIPGNPAINHIARWNGSSWAAVGNIFTGYGTDGDVRALALYNGLVVGGTFNHAGNNASVNNIARWTPNSISWYSFVNGLNDAVYAFANFNYVYNVLIVGGKFSQTMAVQLAVGRIASWDESNWGSLSTGMNNDVYALTVYNGQLVAGGKFTTAGGISAPYIAEWNGSGWASIAPSVDDNVYALSSINGQLVVGGSFHFANNLYASRVASWNGTSWSRMITGMNSTVRAFTVSGSGLYAGGDFETAGGSYRKHISSWDQLQTDTISGRATYQDNGHPVGLGRVLAVRIDVATREIIYVDSVHITTSDSGYYRLVRIPRQDSLYIIITPDDEELDNFMPTYHPSTIDWMSAVQVYPITSLSNIDVNVIRGYPTPGPMLPLIADISGYVYLNFSPQNFITQGFPYWSGSIVYAKLGNQYKGFGVSDIYEHYMIPGLAPGTYDLYANRMGYYSGARVVSLGSSNYDTANFWLDTASLIGVQQIGSEVPKGFSLAQNYPNPFNPATLIKFSIQKTSDVKLSIFNVLGQEVAVIVNENLQPGNYKVSFNASALSSGVYFYKMTAGTYSETKKMVIIK